MMKTQIEKIYQTKKTQKESLKKLRNKYLTTIYKSVVNHETIREINKKLLRDTEESKIKSKILLTYAGKLAKRAKRYDNGAGNYRDNGGLDLLANLVYKLFFRDLEDTNKIINDFTRKEETNSKKEVIKNTIELSRKEGKLFYLASSHSDCAKDHLEYQGKIYVDRYWWQVTRSEDIKKYINSHNIKTIQWVMGEPAYFITRPNCRHYFIPLETDKVLKNRVNKKEGYSKEGNRIYQTQRDLTIDKIKEKIKILEDLYKIRPTVELRNQLIKLKMLLKNLVSHDK